MKKLDLDEYLSRYQKDGYKNHSSAIKTINPRPNSTAASRVKFNNSTCQDFVDKPVLYGTGPVINIQMDNIDSDFHKSQSECLELLHNVRRKLIESDNEMSYFFQNYTKQLQESLIREHMKIREEFEQMIERVFADHERKVREIVRLQGNMEPHEFSSIKKRISEITSRIQHLQSGLKGPNYRPCIAEIVMSDFQSQVRELSIMIRHAEGVLLDGTSRLKVDETRLSRITEDLSGLIVLRDLCKRPLQLSHQNNHNSSISHIVEQPSKSRLKVFEPVVQERPKLCGASLPTKFFNFG